MTLARRCLVLVLATLGLAGSALATPALAADGDPFVRACRTGINAPAFAGCTPNVRGATLGNALSPDGKHLYVSVLSSGAGTFTGIQQYNRNTSTGGLTAGGCWSSTAFEDCTVVPGFSYAFDMHFDPDGDTLYYSSAGASTLWAFDRNSSSGALTQTGDCFGAAAGCTGLTPSNSMTGVVASDSHVYLKVSDGLAVFSRNGSSGALTSIACYSEEFVAGCVDTTGLGGVGYKPEVSSDGKHLYVPFSSPGGVSMFTILGTGLLTNNGCISTNGESGGGGNIECANGADTLSSATATELDPAGKAVYVGASTGVTAYSRNAGSGVLTQTDCVSESATPGCDDVTGVTSVFDLEVPDNGSDLIVNGWGTSTISFFTRASNGALTQRPAPAGCMSPGGTGGACQTVPALGSISFLEVAPNSRDFYPTSLATGLVGTYERDFAPVCPSPTVNVGHNTPQAVSLACSDVNGDPLTYSITRAPATGLTGAIDQGAASVVYSPFSGFSGADSFEYKATARGTDSATTRVNLNVAGPPPPITGPPPPPGPLPIIPSSASFSSLTFPAGFTKFVNLSANNLPAGARVVVSCKAKKRSQRKSCPKRKTYRTSSARRRLNLRKPFAKKRLRAGAKITITITAPGFRGKRVVYTIRKTKRPSSRVTCVRASGSGFGSCV